MTPGDLQDDADDSDDRDVPQATVEEAERLTRLAREAVDDGERDAYRDRREELLDEHGFTARVRRDDDGETLVLHPDEWLQDGTVDPTGIDDLNRAIEVQLSGAGDPEEWTEIDDHNREIAREVRDEHGDVHGDNAVAFADFVSNHYAKAVEEAAPREVREFLGEYFPRNAWPSDEQKAVVGRSIELVFEAAGKEPPQV